MKILCLCERGNSRSVALAWLLKDGMGFDALAIGMRAASEETKNMLYQWADKIILVDKDFEDEIPDEHKNKLRVWDVGKDRFFGGFSRELLAMYRNYMARDENWLINRPDMEGWINSEANND